MSYRERQRLTDIQAAIDAIRSHLRRGDLPNNRVEGSEIRWVSYHFHADPELLLPDEDLLELLAMLPGNAPADGSS